MRLGEPDAFPAGDLYLRDVRGEVGSVAAVARLRGHVHMEGSQLDLMNYTYLETPIGTLLIAGDDERSGASIFRRTARPAAGAGLERIRARARSPRPCDNCANISPAQRTEFDLPLAPEGTEFQRNVWRSLQDIPYGETISYGELARRVGNPKASRAVGAANGQNPIPIVIPCHRVIGANGKLTGFGGGLPTKEALLALEAKQRPFK